MPGTRRAPSDSDAVRIQDPHDRARLDVRCISRDGRPLAFPAEHIRGSCRQAKGRRFSCGVGLARSTYSHAVHRARLMTWIPYKSKSTLRTCWTCGTSTLRPDEHGWRFRFIHSHLTEPRCASCWAVYGAAVAARRYAPRCRGCGTLSNGRGFCSRLCRTLATKDRPMVFEHGLPERPASCPKCQAPLEQEPGGAYCRFGCGKVWILAGAPVSDQLAYERSAGLVLL